MEEKPFPPKKECIPDRLVKSCLKFNNKATTVRSWKIYFTEKDFIKLTNTGPIPLDIVCICAIFCIKGPNICFSYAKYCYSIKELIEHFIKKYTITSQQFRKNLDSIPLISIAKCFPDICCEVFIKGFKPNHLPLDVFGRKLMLKGNRTVILCHVFPMTACKQLICGNTKNILPQLLWIMLKITMLENYKREKPNITQLWNTLDEYMKSKVLPEDKKVELCQKWKLIGEDDELDEFWKLSRQESILQLDRMYRNNGLWIKIRGLLDNYSK